MGAGLCGVVGKDSTEVLGMEGGTQRTENEI